MMNHLCKFYGIKFFKQEESYTSKASFFDGDEIPEYNADNPKEYKFSGKRIKRRYRILAYLKRLTSLSR
ncbi:hypothetical protein B9L23_02005 [Parageobacillus galactosidasius]|uniref:Transposase n=1 Tax=Parageobacillus galactosidasius TaxID=883812 RepID=A0A226QPW1_9BACL|nr:hypothetical protein B9L23_02005 [Parageobacillus galactosidasius]